MRTFTIGLNDSNQRLDRFMSKILPCASQGIIYKSLRKKKIKVNGRRITDGSLRLQQDDILELYVNDEYFGAEKRRFWTELKPKLSVVYEDEHIMVMDKPSGMLSQAEGNKESLEAYMRAYLYKNGEFDEASKTFVPSLCHRIDRNTSGLIIGAKDAESLRVLNQKIRSREIKKFYLCETEGTPEPESGEICGWIQKNETERKMIFIDHEAPDAVPCRTAYRVLRSGANALVEAELLTGRTHQLRAGFAYMGHPLVGDVKYGAAKNGQRQFQHLTAYKLVFSFVTSGGILEYLNGREFSLTEKLQEY